MDILDFIVGLQRTNSNSLGFIPNTTIANRYIANNQFLLETAGKNIGYILHGVPSAKKPLTIAQFAIEYDLRRRGHGMDLLKKLLDRATLANCPSIELRCAEGLNANYFWADGGFELVETQEPRNARKRRINVYRRVLIDGLARQLTLF